MSIGALTDEASLKRWLENQARTPGVLPAASLPFKNFKFGFVLVEFEASRFSEQVEVEHGLGETPKSCGATSDSWAVNAGVEDIDDTVLKIRAGHIVEAVTEEHRIYWWAAC